MSYFGQRDYITEIEKGNVPGHAIMRAIGEREDFGLTVTGEDVWRGNELVPAPASHVIIPTPNPAGERMTVVSESTADNGATATGMLTMRIHYLDATGNDQTEDITLNGTTPVNTVATDIRFVQDIHALTVGSNGHAEGHIKIYQFGDTTLVYDMIALGDNKSLAPHRMIPLGKKLYLKGWHATEANNKRCAFRIRSTDMYGELLPGVFCFKGVAYMSDTASGELELSATVPALSIVKVSGWAVAINSEGSTGWWGILVDD